MLTTRSKLAIARGLFRAIQAGRFVVGRRGTEILCTRRGARWQLDISEGVQLGLYLGTYERSASRLLARLVRPGTTVIDIGANVGAHTLPLAAAVGVHGRVIAVEPTSAASQRLERNLSLNPDLRPRVTTVHAALGAPGGAVEHGYFSGWPLTRGGKRHPVHGGLDQSSGAAAFHTLDGMVTSLALGAVSLVKLDVDGHELPILKGGAGLFERDRPLVVFEFCPYLLQERGEHPESLPEFFLARGYQLFREDCRPVVDVARLAASVPRGAGINLLARHPEPR